MKILFPIGTLYPSQQGGPSNTVYWMAKGLVKNGVEVTCVATNILTQGVPSDKWLSTDYGEVIYCSTRHAMFPVRMMWESFKKLIHCDVVQLTSVFNTGSLFIAFCGIFVGKPVVWSPRGEFDKAALIYSFHKKKWVLWIVRRVFVAKVFFHATSPIERYQITKVLGGKVRIIEIPNYMELPKKIHVKSNKKYLLFIGRIHPIKAINNLIRAVGMSKKFISSDFILWIAGNDQSEYSDSLKAMVESLEISHKVKFVGHVEGHKKQELFAGAHFTLIPSHTENFGNVVIESLAQGTPVIASKGTPWEILEGKKAGFWCSNDPIELRRQIERAIEMNETEYEQYRENAFQLATQEYNVYEKTNVWIETYQSLLKNPN